MAVTQPQDNNKLVRYTREINIEWYRQNMFSPYMGDSLTSIIRTRNELKAGGDQMNIPTVRQLRGNGKATGTLVGNEEKIDNYGQRVWVDWLRHAVETTKAQQQKDSADIFGEAKPLLSGWAKRRLRDEIIVGFMSLPSTAEPAALNTDEGQRVNGILYHQATAAQRNTWNADNSDRVLYGNATANYNATHATALANVDTTNDLFNTTSLGLLQNIAESADPAITPFETDDGYSWYVVFAGTKTFNDLQASLQTINLGGRPRERDWKNNPLFTAGDLIYNSMIIRKVPEIDKYVTDYATTLLTAGASSARVNPVFFCGQQALAIAYAQMIRPTGRDETDYDFRKGVGVEMAYGIAKMFNKSLDSTKLVQWGVVSGFFAATA